MKYALLVYQTREGLESVPAEELESIVGACGTWIGKLEQTGNHVFSAGLQSPRTATTVKMSAGRLSVTDGPFAETKEYLGGFTIVEARDLNEAIQLSRDFPPAAFGRVEIRPVMTPDADLADPLDRKLAAAIGSSAKATS